MQRTCASHCALSTKNNHADASPQRPHKASPSATQAPCTGTLCKAPPLPRRTPPISRTSDPPSSVVGCTPPASSTHLRQVPRASVVRGVGESDKDVCGARMCTLSGVFVQALFLSTCLDLLNCIVARGPYPQSTSPESSDDDASRRVSYACGLSAEPPRTRHTKKNDM